MTESTFSFIQITDHHILPSDTAFLHGFSTNYSLRCVLEHIAGHAAGQVDFIVSTGDLVDHAFSKDYQFVCDMLGLKGRAALPGPHLVSACGLQDFPVYFLPGNHDDRDWFFRSLFSDAPQSALMNAAFVHKGVQLVFLDWGPGVKGVLHAETVSFLQEALEKGLPSILLMHHPVAPVGVSWLDEFLADGLEAFWNMVAGRPVLGIFAGHVHAVFETGREGTPFATVGSTGFQFALQDEPLMCLTPPQYRIVRVEDGKLTTEVVDVPLAR